MKKKGEKLVQSGELAALAKELTLALLQRPRSQPSSAGPRKEEWTCTCGCTNFLDRVCCRKCKAKRPKESSGEVPKESSREFPTKLAPWENILAKHEPPKESSWDKAVEAAAQAGAQENKAHA